MPKFTFKNNRSTGRWASFDPESHLIKLGGHEVGSIGEIASRRAVTPEEKANVGKFAVRFAVKKEPTTENPAPFKWVKVKRVFDTADQAKEWVVASAEMVLKDLQLHHVNESVRQIVRKLLDDTESDRQAAREQTDTKPSEEEKKSGDYDKGMFQAHGLTFVLENPAGSTRSGNGPDGKWSVKMPCDYGYFESTDGVDGDEVDVFVGPDDGGKIFVVDQKNAETGEFDEHKILYGFPDREAAAKTYDASFSDGKGPQRRGENVREVSPQGLKSFLRGLGESIDSLLGEGDAQPGYDVPIIKLVRFMLGGKWISRYVEAYPNDSVKFIVARAIASALKDRVHKEQFGMWIANVRKTAKVKDVSQDSDLPPKQSAEYIPRSTPAVSASRFGFLGL